MRETESFSGTQAQSLVDALDVIYRGIDEAQREWKSVSPFACPDGCGSCCVDFEPDVLECEALYLAAWMIYHQEGRADAIVSGTFTSPGGTPLEDATGGCVLFDPASPWHCTVYGGRCLICRLFGYAGDRGKDGRPRLRPCKFLPFDADTDARRQYHEAELLERFGMVPPIMGDITAQALALSPDGARDRKPLRVALREAIEKIRMLQRFSRLPPEPNEPEPNPESPMPRAS